MRGEPERTLGVLGAAALAAAGVCLAARAAVCSPGAGRKAAAVMHVPAWDAALAAAGRIDVNAAGRAELERLPGIGRSLARRIVAERRARGTFLAPEELARVPGIGPRTIAALRDRLTTRH